MIHYLANVGRTACRLLSDSSDDVSPKWSEVTCRRCLDSYEHEMAVELAKLRGKLNE